VLFLPGELTTDAGQSCADAGTVTVKKNNRAMSVRVVLRISNLLAPYDAVRPGPDA
jgi:hypothetical protein